MADDTISRLKRRRGTIRTGITKYMKNIETELQKDTISEDILENHLERLIENAKELQSLDMELQKIIDLDELETDINLSMEYNDKITEWKNKARKKLNSLSKSILSVPIETTPNINHQNLFENTLQDKLQVKLPKLSIQKFYGEISQWLSFWNSFESAIHNNVSLDKISKFNYLKAYLSGTALQTIEGYAITPENYDNAISCLKERFGRPEILINQHISNILAIPPLKHSNNVKAFRNLYDRLITEIRSLETLKIIPNTYSAVLCPLLLKILPHDLVFEFHREVENSTYEIDTLIKFLLKQLISRERSCFSKIESQRNPSEERIRYFRNEEKNEKRKSTAADLLISESKNNRYSCIFCNNDHDSPDGCNYALKLPLDEKKNILLKRGACFRCTGPHLSKNCQKKIRCKNCNKRHLSILCFYSNNKMKEKPREEAKDKNTCENKVLANNTCSREVLLQTLIVSINGNDSNHFLRIIIDLGSQKSYVSKYVVDIMKLKCIGEETISHGLFGGMEKSEKHKKYCIKLSNIENNFTLEVEVMDQKKICTPIPKINDFKCIQELKRSGIFLSDIAINKNCCLFENDSNEIHVLLGADCASKLFLGDVKHLTNGMLAMKTNLGWTIVGNSREENIEKSNILLTLHARCLNIQDYWSLDVIGIHDPEVKMMRSELEKATKDHFLRNITRNEEGRYSVSLPWINDHPPLSNCRNLAERRLASCVKSLKRKGRLNDYENVFKEWLANDIIEEIPHFSDPKNIFCHIVLYLRKIP